jgi:hypothetical protein
MASLSLDLMVLARSDDSLRGGDGMLENPMCYFRPTRPVSEYGRCLFLPVKVAALPVLPFAPLGLARSSFDLRNFICLSPVVIRCGTKSNVRNCSACALVERCNECQICVAYEHTNMSCLSKMIGV